MAKLQTAAYPYPFPGDELVARPTRTWTQSVEIAAARAEVWPWIAQLGATRAGFYSWAWLEEISGCRLLASNAVHASAEMKRGEPLFVWPNRNPLRVVGMQRGTWLIAHGTPTLTQGSDDIDQHTPRVSWLLLLESIADARSRCTSRVRISVSGGRGRWQTLTLEPLARVLLARTLDGLRRRVEQTGRAHTDSSWLPHAVRHIV